MFMEIGFCFININFMNICLELYICEMDSFRVFGNDEICYIKK